MTAEHTEAEAHVGSQRALAPPGTGLVPVSRSPVPAMQAPEDFRRRFLRPRCWALDVAAPPFQT
jgi:hypothetical protein